MNFKIGDKVLPNVIGRVLPEYKSWGKDIDPTKVMVVRKLFGENKVFLLTTEEPLSHPSSKYALVHNAEEL